MVKRHHITLRSESYSIGKFASVIWGEDKGAHLVSHLPIWFMGKLNNIHICLVFNVLFNESLVFNLNMFFHGCYAIGFIISNETFH